MLFEGELESTRKKRKKGRLKIRIETGDRSYTIEIQRWKIFAILLALISQLSFLSLLKNSKERATGGKSEELSSLSMKISDLKNQVAEIQRIHNNHLNFIKIQSDEKPVYLANYKEMNKDLKDDIEENLKELEKSLKVLREEVLRRKTISDYFPTLKPVDGVIKSGFGSRLHPIFGEPRPHTGIDIAADVGTPVLAAGAGRVIEISYTPGLGQYIKIKHVNDLQTIYAHLSQIFVRKGEFVEKGQIIGAVGNSGLVTGPHLHFEIQYKGKPIDPQIFLVD